MLRAVLFFWAAIVSVSAGDMALVKATDFWRYQPVYPAAVEPRPGWMDLGYNDTSWKLGIASFTTPISGAPGVIEATFLPADAPTVCFRNVFTLDDPAFVRWLTLRIDYEHGFVAYLNGQEITRRSFPETTNAVPLTAEALPHPRLPTEWIDVSAHIPKLRAGANVLAIQLHGAGATSSGLLLVTELLANFTRGPFIQNTTTNSTQLIWHTQVPTTGFVLYGKEQAHVSVAFANDLSKIHALTLPNLEPNQPYVYRVFVEAGGSAAVSDWATFRTLKRPGTPISFLVVGDTGQASVGQYKIAERMKEMPADLLMHLGDIVYPYFNELHVDARCFSIYREHMRSVPYFFALGNHDEYGWPAYLNVFYLPTNSVSRTEHFYSFDHGDAHFVVLETDTTVGRRYDPGSQEYDWLEADLAATRQPWKFLFFHHVVRSSSIHTQDDYLFDGTYDKYQLQATIGVLAQRYGAQVIFNGHDHNFERFAPFDGMTSMVSGGGGAYLYTQIYDPIKGGLFVEPGSLQFFNRHNFLRVNIDGPQLRVEAVDENGVPLDRFYYSQLPGGAAPYPATWGAANVEATAGTDSAGNIPGQVFDFTDAGIPTLAGLNANLGRVHFRNDRDFLYVGLEAVSLHENQVVALFVENTAHPGVAHLGALGNAQVDPAGEGADGLDALAQLSFKNFRPSIGCLLGDELADTTLRSFKRRDMTWATGQGVFRLQTGFPTVPGARVQQFNRNPQTAAVPAPESTADFMEVAIPWTALGAPGSLVRAGAVVIRERAAATGAPEIDTGFVGQSLAPLPDGGALLEPISVQLAADPDPHADAFGFRAVIIGPRLVRFSWNSVAGASYQLQSTPAIDFPFEDLTAQGLPMVATGGQTSYDLSLDVVAPPQFFRLVAN